MKKIILIATVLLSSCMTSKTAYDFLKKKSPALFKHDTLKLISVVTVEGFALDTATSLASICDSLEFWKKNADENNRYKVVAIKEDNRGHIVRTIVDKKSGFIESECTGDKEFVTVTVLGICPERIITDKEFWAYGKVKYEKYCDWFMVFAICIVVIALFLILKRLF